MISKSFRDNSELRSSKLHIGFQPFNGPGQRASHSSLYGSIRQAQSPNVTLQRDCNLRDMEADVLCGMFTAYLKLPVSF